MTAFSVGVAQESGLLSIEDPSTTYLGEGWTSLNPEQEELITIRHQLTMTTGLDDGLGNTDCTDPDCLSFLAPPGTRWAYHNAPYTLLDEVIKSASGQSLNIFTNLNVLSPIGAQRLFLPLGYNNVFFSKPRSMARYGLLLLSERDWDGAEILADKNYTEEMTNTSQDLNLSYGYLTWLNGKSSFMIPTIQNVFSGSPVEEAPDDMFSALGKNGQIINVVPSQQLVVIRMGESPGDNGLVSLSLSNSIWSYINKLNCNATSTIDQKSTNFLIYPQPIYDELNIQTKDDSVYDKLTIMDLHGRIVRTEVFSNFIDVSSLDTGIYFL